MIEPYADLGDVQIYQGDMRQVLPQLDLTADCVVADPPYGETSLAWDRWSGWPASRWSRCLRSTSSPSTAWILTCCCTSTRRTRTEVLWSNRPLNLNPTLFDLPAEKGAA